MSQPQLRPSQKTLSAQSFSMNNVQLPKDQSDKICEQSSHKYPTKKSFHDRDEQNKENQLKITINGKQKSEKKIQRARQSMDEMAMEETQQRIFFQGKVKNNQFPNKNQAMKTENLSQKSSKGRLQSVHNERTSNNEGEKIQSQRIGNRNQMELLKRMVEPLREEEREYFTVFVQEGIFNDIFTIHLEGFNECPLFAVPEKTIFGKKFSIFCGNQMVGRMESNCTGSIFNIYQINLQKVKTTFLGRVIYDYSCTLKQQPRKVQIELQKQAAKHSPFSHEDQGKMKLSMIQPVLSKKKGGYVALFQTDKKVYSSIHNVMFEYEKETVFKFFRVSDTQYHLEIKNLLSPLISYCYLLSSFSFKWACQ